VVKELVGSSSPYSSLSKSAAANMVDQGQMGVCVVQIPLSQVAAPGGLPVTPPLHGPIIQLGFVDEQCCSNCATAAERKSALLPIVTAKAEYLPVPGNACTTNVPSNIRAAAPAAEPRTMPALVLNGESAPRRKSFIDITASPCFGHALDYSWLRGQIEYSRILGTWRLRYASVDEADRFAGSVTLVENTHVGYLRDGEYVRVEGHLVDPTATGSAPPYKIQSFKAIDKPNDQAP